MKQPGGSGLQDSAFGFPLPRVTLALLTLLAFANAVPNGFVSIDHWQIEEGGLIAHSWPELWSSWQQPLGSIPGWEGAAPYARPLVVAVLSLVASIFGTSALPYHALLLLLHLANVLLVYAALGSLQIPTSVAWLVSAVFAVHPMQTAAVSWISGIADPLFTCFALIAFRLQRAAAGPRRFRMMVAALASFALALGAKETAAVLPLLMVGVYVLLPTARAPYASVRDAVVSGVLPFFGLLAPALLYRLWVLQGSAFGRVTEMVPLTVRLTTLPRLMVDYLTLPLRMSGLTVCDDFALSLRWDTSASLSLAVILALAVGLIAARRFCRPVLFGAVWMLLGLLPVLQLTPLLHYRADRFFYFPFIGWALACVSALRHAALGLQRRYGIAMLPLRRGCAVAAVVGLGGLTILTVQRNRLFADEITLFETTLVASPHCREARGVLGDTYLRAGREHEASAQYRLALESFPDRASYVVPVKVLINLGMAELRESDYGAALGAFEHAHELQPGLLHPLFGLGAANLGLGRPAEALPFLEQAYAQDANDPDVVFSFARANDALGRRSEAQELYQHYLQIAPRGRARGIAEARLRRLAHRLPPDGPD